MDPVMAASRERARRTAARTMSQTDAITAMPHSTPKTGATAVDGRRRRRASSTNGRRFSSHDVPGVWSSPSIARTSSAVPITNSKRYLLTRIPGTSQYQSACLCPFISGGPDETRVYRFCPWFQVVVKHVRDHDRSVSATRASDADRQVTLPFFLVAWEHKVDEVGKAGEEFVGVGLPKDIQDNALVEACTMCEVFIVVWVGQEANVKEEIQVDRQAVLVAKGHYIDGESLRMLRSENRLANAVL